MQSIFNGASGNRTRLYSLLFGFSLYAHRDVAPKWRQDIQLLFLLGLPPFEYHLRILSRLNNKHQAIYYNGYMKFLNFDTRYEVPDYGARESRTPDNSMPLNHFPTKL